MTAPKKKTRTPATVPTARAGSLPLPGASLQAEFVAMVENFDDRSQEWRRLFSEVLGTFFLVLVAAGGGDDGTGVPGHHQPHRGGDRTRADGVGRHPVHGQDFGAHLNPAVSIAFALRGDFPWVRVPGYIVMQLIGATLAAWFLQAVIGVSAQYGSNYPAAGYSSFLAFVMETVLTFGLVSVILGTASGAQNVGIVGAPRRGRLHRAWPVCGVARISGASMNPARTFGPHPGQPRLRLLLGLCRRADRRRGHRRRRAFVLRGRGGGRSGSAAAQGVLFTEVANPGA